MVNSKSDFKLLANNDEFFRLNVIYKFYKYEQKIVLCNSDHQKIMPFTVDWMLITTNQLVLSQLLFCTEGGCHTLSVPHAG